jgi:5-methyltetrahydrofolate--homocysteine methyltransferase
MSLKEIYQNVIEGQAPAVEAGVQAQLEAGASPEAILNDALISAMDFVGQQFEKGEFFVPEMLIAARAMQAGLNLLKPHLVEKGVQSAGKVAIGTVKGDLHDIGKNLVAMMLEGAGFEVEDLGTDVDPTKFLEAAQQGTQVIGMSALLTTTMASMSDVIEAIEDGNLRDKVKIIIGGAPVTEDFAQQIGADGYAPDASSAVSKIRELVKSN